MSGRVPPLGSEGQAADAYRPVVRIRRDTEPETPRQLQHRLVHGEHETAHLAQPPPLRGVDERSHERGRQSDTAESRGDGDRKLATRPISLDEVDRTDALLSGIDGPPRHSFRQPRGVMPPRMLANFFRRRRRTTYWSYDSLDYSRRPAAELIEIIRRHPVQPGDILLMHDDSTLSLEMLTLLIPEWKAQGFTLEALPAEA